MTSTCIFLIITACITSQEDIWADVIKFGDIENIISVIILSANEFKVHYILATTDLALSSPELDNCRATCPGNPFNHNYIVI